MALFPTSNGYKSPAPRRISAKNRVITRRYPIIILLLLSLFCHLIRWFRTLSTFCNRRITMTSPYYSYSYPEVTKGPTDPSQVMALFVFRLSGIELAAHKKVSMRKHPSLGEPPQGSEAACLVRLATAQARPLAHYRTRRDIFAIFATTAYLATSFQHDVSVMLLENLSRRQESAMFSPAQFDPLRPKKDALAFYAAMFELLGVRRIDDKPITLKIAMLPTDGPS